jgi:hypothetical protein
MPHAEGDDAGDHRLQPLGDEGLEHVGLDRQAQAGHRRDLAGAAGDRHADLAGGDGAAGGLDPADAAVLDAEAGDLAVLDQIDAAPVGAAGEAPGDRVVARGAGAALQRPP